MSPSLGQGAVEEVGQLLLLALRAAIGGENARRREGPVVGAMLAADDDLLASLACSLTILLWQRPICTASALLACRSDN